MKRKLFALVAAFILTASLFTFTGCSSREEVLRVRTWTDYTDQEYVEEAFPEYYYRQTGKTVRVEFSDFTNNEDLYMEIETNKEDYDLICPSDYAVERLIANKLLLPLDKGIVTGYDEALDTGILEKMRVFDPELKYSFPYAWGTLGIMYNTGKDVIEDDMRSWGALWNEDVEGDYFNKIYMKDSVRDAFAVANIYNHREELLRLADEYGYASAQYQALLNSMFATPDTDTVKAVKETLIRQREVFFKYESEDGKSELEADGDEAYMGLFWSCDAGLVMPENTALRYSIPEEGANFYVDSFVIPKYARNVDAAQHFLQFLTDTETA
jgi:spermidine/putrescine-binding protein